MLGGGNRWTVELLQYRTSLHESIDQHARLSPQYAAQQRLRLFQSAADFEGGEISAAELLEEFARIRHDLIRATRSSAEGLPRPS